MLTVCPSRARSAPRRCAAVPAGTRAHAPSTLSCWRFRWLPLLVVAISLTLTTALFASDEDFRLGKGYFHNKFYDKAAVAFERVRRDRGSAHREEALYLLGESYRVQEKLAEAAEAYQALLADYSSTQHRADAELGCGECLARTGKFDEAIPLLHSVLRRGNSAEAQYWLGQAQGATGDEKSAIASYRALLRSSADHYLAPFAAFALAGHLKVADRATDAAAVLDGFDASRVPQDLQANWALSRGDLALALSDPERARSEYRKITEGAGAQHSLALAGLCWAARDLNDGAALEAAYAKFCRKVTGGELRADVDILYGSWHAGLANINKAVRALSPHATGERGNEARFWHGVALVNAKQPAEAAVILGKVQGTDEWSRRAALHCESAWRRAQEWQKALDVAERFLAAHSEDAQATPICAGAVESAYRLGRDADVLRLERRFQSDYGDARWAGAVMRFAAEAALRSGQHREAITRFRMLWGSADAELKPELAVRLAHALVGQGTVAGHATDTAALISLRDSLSGPAAAEVGVLLGEALRDAGRASEARDAFQRAAAADPDGALGSRAALERAALIGQDPEAAARAYEEVLARAGAGPVRARALIDLADLRVAAGRLQEAVPLYETYISENSDGDRLPQARVGLAFCRWQLGGHDAALTALSGLDGAQLDPEVASEALYLRGRVLAALGDDRATATLEQYRQQYNNGVRSDEVCLELASLYEKQGDADKQRACLQECVSRAQPGPGHEAALYQLAWHDQERGDKQRAKAAFQRLLDEHPQSALAGDVHYRLADLAYDAGQYAEARRHYDATLKSADQERLGERAHYRIGWSHVREEKWPQAGAAFLQLADQFPQGELAGEALLLAADAAKNTEQPAEERARLRRFVDGHPRHEKILEGSIRLGELQVSASDWDRARTLLEPLRTASLEGEWLPRHRIALARAVRGLGSAGAALPLLEAALAEGKALAAEAKFEIGMTYRTLGRSQEAIDAFMSGAFLYPFRPWAVRSYLEAGRDLMATDKFTEARRLLARAVEEDPDGVYGREAARLLSAAAVEAGGK